MKLEIRCLRKSTLHVVNLFIQFSIFSLHKLLNKIPIFSIFCLIIKYLFLKSILFTFFERLFFFKYQFLKEYFFFFGCQKKVSLRIHRGLYIFLWHLDRIRDQLYFSLQGKFWRLH